MQNEYGERIMRLETKIDTVEAKVDRIEGKLDSIRDSFPKVYGTKKEMCEMEARLIERDKNQDKKWGFIERNAFSILVVIAGAIYLILKGQGLI